MSVDTKFTYNPLPYNIADKNNNNNRNGLLPSYQYKKKRIIWLNSFYATSSINNGATSGACIYYEFSFNIPPFQLYNCTNLKVVSYISNENTAKPMYIKIKNLQYQPESTYCSDKEGFPLLYVSHLATTGMLANDKFSLTLTPQFINNITIKINDSFISRDTGFSINVTSGTGHFILGLLFEDDDLLADNVVSQYK
jgi:hypothetical protein